MRTSIILCIIVQDIKQVQPNKEISWNQMHTSLTMWDVKIHTCIDQVLLLQAWPQERHSKPITQRSKRDTFSWKKDTDDKSNESIIITHQSAVSTSNNKLA